ncbi:diaminopimelate decarboxylase [Dokdonella sp.]|uniref:diaminopimelate decarboxylase n=1 Tax=Dokdonella sp. TaxID=2291710 RepID=UPI001B25D95D|nr:diaminopimelate decarboxylase [Dokdonella sp.]MBO9663764.1 diaminopimelate decarboxylase [Dokdonella sp.]
MTLSEFETVADAAAVASQDPESLFEGVDPAALADRVGTPFHAYSAAAIRRRIAELQQALQGLDALVCFAVKANPNRAILTLVADAGLGADIVSGGELRRSLEAGIAPKRIVFSGVGKSEQEIDAALAAGIARFNLESRDELECLDRLARERGVEACAAVRINPDVDAGTHEKISTGRAENKFGVPIDEARCWFAERMRHPNVRLDGLHVHIGSQILDLEPFRRAFARVAAFRRELAAAGHAIASIDVGGGFGVRYRNGESRLDAQAWAGVLREAFADYDGRFVVEPGRWLVAEAGLLLTRVLRVKRGVERDFLVLDAAMNDLARPSLYDAWHEIVPLHGAARAMRRYDVVGPVCETGDTFARDRLLPECAAGDLVAILGTGAYGASMASTYNSRPLAAEVLLDDGRYSIVRRRQSYEEMTAGESAGEDWTTP